MIVFSQTAPNTSNPSGIQSGNSTNNGTVNPINSSSSNNTDQNHTDPSHTNNTDRNNNRDQNENSQNNTSQGDEKDFYYVIDLAQLSETQSQMIRGLSATL